KSYTQAKLQFNSSDNEPVNTKWEYWETSKRKVCILSSGGKDSLLSYGLMNDLKYETHPIFINESGRHWLTALNAYKYFSKNIENTSRVWVNSDRVFSFMLRHLPFIRKDFADVRSDEYPIRLWTVAVFLFGVLPLLRKRKISRLIIGDEYDTTDRKSFKGITHYNGLYDQSRYFDDALSRYYMRKGWATTQFSLLRPLSEMLIETILAKEYPDLQKYQVSCHAAHTEDEKVYPCGKCEKCRRIVGMLTAIGVNPKNCGYTSKQIEQCLIDIVKKGVSQEEEGVRHLIYNLNSIGKIKLSDDRVSQLKSYPEILKLRFHTERSPLNSVPSELRKGLYEIFLKYADGSVKNDGRNWEIYNPFSTDSLSEPYKFEFTGEQYKKRDTEVAGDNYNWAELTWPEAEEKLKRVDIALLPVGAIEQHGPHLPLDTDAFDAEYLAKKVAETCSEPKPFVLPLIPYGVSYHHDDFSGTISVSNESLSKIVYEIGMNIAKQGIKKLIIINGHGDNAPSLNFAAQMINRDAKIFVAVDTGETSDVDMDNIATTPNDVHAGEIETSTTLAVRPNLVKMDKAEKTVLKFSSRYLNFSSLRGVPWYVRTKRISESGVMGDPTKANSKKGKKMWEIMIAHLVAFVEDLKSLSLDEIHQKKY
ncbi:MAG: creatininase family protein, partial [Ignavibacteria bacterium]